MKQDSGASRESPNGTAGAIRVVALLASANIARCRRVTAYPAEDASAAKNIRVGCPRALRRHNTLVSPERRVPRSRSEVPGAGLEPARGCPHKILSLARLPISPPRLPRRFDSVRRPKTTSISGHVGWIRLESGKRDSNPRPQPWQGCALPTELFPQRGNTNWGSR